MAWGPPALLGVLTLLHCVVSLPKRLLAPCAVSGNDRAEHGCGQAMGDPKHWGKRQNLTFLALSQLRFL